MKNYRAISLWILLVGAFIAHGQQNSNLSFESLITAAQQAQTDGNYHEAAEAYRKATKLRPDIPELWANLGLMQHESGMYAEAILSLQQAIRLKPSLYVPNLFLGIDLTRMGRPREAIPFLARAEKMNSSDLQPVLALGRAYFALGDFSRAAEEASHATDLDPGQASAWFSLGMARLEDVEASSRRMAEDDRATPWARALFAESLTRQGRYLEAADLYQDVLAVSTQPPCVHGELGFIYLKEGNTEAAEAEFEAGRHAQLFCSLAVLGRARLQADAGFDGAALTLLQELWERDHGFLRANVPLFTEGMTADNSRKFSTFVEQQKTAAAGGDESGEPLLDLLVNVASQSVVPDISNVPQERGVTDSAEIRAAEEDYAAGRYGKCASLMSGNLRTGNEHALHLLCACASLTGDAALASRASATLLAAHPNSAEALYWSIRAGEQLAFRALERFEQLAPASERSHLLIGDIYRQRERFDDAIKEYGKALDLSPNDPAALLGLASAYFGDANYPKTVETLQPALQRAPNDAEINLLMGQALLAQHEFGDAEPFLRKALNAKPEIRPYVHALLGKTYAETGRTQDAIAQLKLGSESDQDGTVHYQLARMYRSIGDNSDATAALEQMKAIQQRRREGAVIETEGEHPSALDDTP